MEFFCLARFARVRRGRRERRIIHRKDAKDAKRKTILPPTRLDKEAATCRFLNRQALRALKPRHNVVK